jgi:hypothetical protein
VNSGRLDNGTGRIIIIHPVLVLETFGNRSSLVAVNRTIWFMLELEDPFRVNHINTNTRGNKMLAPLFAIATELTCSKLCKMLVFRLKLSSPWNCGVMVDEGLEKAKIASSKITSREM